MKYYVDFGVKIDAMSSFIEYAYSIKISENLKFLGKFHSNVQFYDAEGTNR